MGIEHRCTTPLWSQANEKVERQNRTLLKAIRIAQVEGKSRKDELFRFLLAQRSTTHSTTGSPPAELMLGRPIRCKLPILSGSPPTTPSVDHPIRDTDAVRKQPTTDYANERCRASNQEAMKVGETVLLERTATANKLDSTYLHESRQVVERKGDQVVVESPTGIHI